MFQTEIDCDPGLWAKRVNGPSKNLLLYMYKLFLKFYVSKNRKFLKVFIYNTTEYHYNYIPEVEQ